MQAAWAAVRVKDSYLNALFHRIKRRGGAKKAIVAVAHKMIRLIFLLLQRRQPYIDPGINYAEMSARKNAPRWIKQLKAIGKWPSTAATSRTAAAAAA